MSLPTFVGISKIDWEKVQNSDFRLKMAAILRGRGCSRSNLQTRCRLSLAMPLPNFVGIFKIYWEKSAKTDFLDLKWPSFCRISSNQAQNLHCSLGPPKICVCKILLEYLHNLGCKVLNKDSRTHLDPTMQWCSGKFRISKHKIVKNILKKRVYEGIQ